MTLRQGSAAGVLFCTMIIVAAIGCGGCTVKPGTGTPGTSTKGSTGSGGSILVDGSSTVYLIMQAIAEEFQKLNKTRVDVGESGTGGGFKKFVRGEIDFANASRPIVQSEIDLCKKNGIEYLELKIALDGLSVVVNPQNDWCSTLTVSQLKRIWEPDSKVKKWKDVDPAWPDLEIKLYGADTSSGTFEYFTEAICGKKGATRTDYFPNADDNVLVRGVAGDKGALGYFGFGYYVKNAASLKVVAIAPSDDPASAVVPTKETVETGKYVPLSRPLFLYVNKQSLKRPEVAALARFVLKEGQSVMPEVGYVVLHKEDLDQSIAVLEQALKQ